MKGVLLVNLGSPDTTKTKDVKRYLGEFLMDERVIDIAYWKRLLLIKGIILQVRPKKSGTAYKKIWWEEGSPLVVISERFSNKVTSKSEIPVSLAMRYGSMSMEKGFKELTDQGVDEILLVPLYPHYAMSSYETVTVKAEQIIAAHYPNVIMDILPTFYNKPEYIKAMSDNIKNHCKLDGSCCERNSVAHHTCYRHQCFETTKGIVENLGLKDGTFSNSFQSRLLKDPWLKPYTDFELEKFPNEGKKKVAVVTPAFVSDCLETLEEIAMEGKEDFLEAGGTDFKHIPCMNDNDDWVDVMTNWIQNWQKTN